jgi:hypothetical protein
MTSSQKSSDDLISKLKQDPKKAVLGALVLVLVLLWIKMALGGHSPKSASAMTIPTPAPASILDSNNKPKAVDSIGLLQDWVNEPLPESVSRNMFEVKLDYFPMDGAHAGLSSGTVNDPTFWEKLAKSIDAQADQQHKRENLIQNLRQQAGQLNVTSTLMGPHPKAMVNGEMVGEGEFVAQFRVTEIRARSVVVEREGIKLDIPMK